MRTHSSSVKIAKKNAPYGAPQRAVCGFEAVFRLTHTVNQAVIHHDQYSTAGEHGNREKGTQTDHLLSVLRAKAVDEYAGWNAD